MIGSFERWFALGFVGCALLSGCNLSDPVTALPSEGCVNDSDCSDHGACSVNRGVGVCVCSVGYTGDECDVCDDGYDEDGAGGCIVMVNMMTNNNTNNPPMCEADEVLLDDQCVSNSCDPNPCGPGSCDVTGEGDWTCDCPDGSTGTECVTCQDTCINGSCDADGACICDQGWDGLTCEVCAQGFTGMDCSTCTANAFGPDCQTCEDLTSTQPWWDAGYAGRQGLIVFNPASSTRAVLGGSVVQYEFPHDLLVQNGGADPTGRDFRVVAAPDADLDRILGFDSSWNLPDTRVWFPTAGDIQVGEFQLVFLYTRNPAAPTPRVNAGNVLRQDRGWFHGPGGPVYSAQPQTAGQYSLQLRQKDPGTMQIYFHDSGNDITSAAQLRMFDTTTGAQVQNISYGSSQGSTAVPADIFDEVSGLPNSLRVEFLISPGNDQAAIYLGNQQVQVGSSTLTYTATISRAINVSAVPEVFPCPAETAP